MSCLITAGVPIDCEFSVGGILNIWLTNWEWVDSITDSGADNVLDLVTWKDVTNITAISQANPAVVTAAGHGLANGDVVYITGVLGMTEVNDQFFTVANATPNTFELSGIDSTAYGAYTSGGTVQIGKWFEFGFTRNQASYTQELQADSQKFIQQTLLMNVPKDSPAVIEIMENLALGRFIGIVKNRKGQYRVLGRNNGLEATVLNNNSGAAEADFAGYEINLVASELEIAKEFDTDPSPVYTG